MEKQFKSSSDYPSQKRLWVAMEGYNALPIEMLARQQQDQQIFSTSCCPEMATKFASVKLLKENQMNQSMKAIKNSATSTEMLKQQFYSSSDRPSLEGIQTLARFQGKEPQQEKETTEQQHKQMEETNSAYESLVSHVTNKKQSKGKSAP